MKKDISLILDISAVAFLTLTNENHNTCKRNIPELIASRFMQKYGYYFVGVKKRYLLPKTRTPSPSQSQN